MRTLTALLRSVHACQASKLPSSTWFCERASTRAAMLTALLALSLAAQASRSHASSARCCSLEAA